MKYTKAQLAQQRRIEKKILDILQPIIEKDFDRRRESERKREETLLGRLNAIEQAGVPENTLEKIQWDMRQISHNLRKQEQAITALLSYFKAEDSFKAAMGAIDNTPEDDKTLKVDLFGKEIINP